MSEACFTAADILLPAASVPLDPWACIAVDQFTSQPEYWQRAEQRAGLQKRAQRLLLAGNIREDHAAGHAAITEAVFRDLADGVLRSLRRGGNHPQKRPVGQIVIA